MKIYRLNDKNNNNKKLLKELNVQGAGVSIMSKKMQLYIFQIKDMPTPALNILKQDALSIGAELAVPSGVITCVNTLRKKIVVFGFNTFVKKPFLKASTMGIFIFPVLDNLCSVSAFPFFVFTS